MVRIMEAVIISALLILGLLDVSAELDISVLLSCLQNALVNIIILLYCLIKYC